MPWTTVNSGEYITSAWANANVRDQVVTPFSSTGSGAGGRGAITPVQGMVSTLTSGTLTEGVYQYTTANSWRLPWNMPWGYVIGDVLTTTEQITSTSFASVNGWVTASFTPINRRRYKVTVSGVANTISAGLAQSISIQVVSTATSSVVNGGDGFAQNLGATDVQAFNSTFFFNNTATAATTYAVQAKVTSGTIGLAGAIYDCQLIVEDMGPTGAPS